MRSLMLIAWYATCAAAGAAAVILAGTVLKFLDGSEDGTFNGPVIVAISLVVLAPLMLLSAVWVSEGYKRTSEARDGKLVDTS